MHHMSWSTGMDCVNLFCEGVIPKCRWHQQTSWWGNVAGFPGSIGSEDCIKWDWKNCLSA
jgi:hypothetical protein